MIEPRQIVLCIVAGFLAATLTNGSETPSPAPSAEVAPSAPTDLAGVGSLVREGRLEEAAAALDAIERERPDDPAVLLLHGEILLSLDRAAEARALLEHAVELEPERPRVHFQLATAKLRSGDRPGALEAFAREIEINTDPQVQIMSHLNRSLVFQQQGRRDAAAQELEAVLGLEPAREPVYGDLASLYFEIGNLDRAAETLERGSQAGFRSAEHWFTLAGRRLESGAAEPAVAAFERALEIDSALADAERGLALALERLGRKEEAASHLRRFLELKPDAPEAKEIAEHLKALGP